MEFAIAYPARPDAWKDLAIAEDHGFTHAWFYDSQLLYSDVFVCLALAAEHTKRIKLGPGVAIPSNRIEPVTAHSIATINQLAGTRDAGYWHRIHRTQHDGPAAGAARTLSRLRTELPDAASRRRDAVSRRRARAMDSVPASRPRLHQYKGPYSDSHRGQRPQGDRARGRTERRMDHYPLQSGTASQ